MGAGVVAVVVVVGYELSIFSGIRYAEFDAKFLWCVGVYAPPL